MSSETPEEFRARQAHGHFRALCDQIAEAVRLREQPWREFALCRGGDVSLWFPSRREPNARVQEVKAICEQCPVQGPCRDQAARFDEPYGVWGGVTFTERRRQTVEGRPWPGPCREPGCPADAAPGRGRWCEIHRYRKNRTEICA